MMALPRETASFGPKPPRRAWHAITYLITAILMLYTIGLHLQVTPSTLADLDWIGLAAAWPVFLLIAGCPLLLVSAVIWLFDTCPASRIAFIAGLLGLAYYSPSICVQFLWISLFIFVLPKGLVGFVIPWFPMLVIVWRLNPKRLCAAHTR